MKIAFPKIPQSDFDYAFDCLNDCIQQDAAEFGFNYPYFTPGGRYGAQWWQLDSALALSGYKWKNRSFAETSLLNFIESQKEDGRICLWGKDILPVNTPEEDWHSEQNEGVSSLPKIFDVAYHILQGTTDASLITKTFDMLIKYIDWWYRDRYDKKTGLFTAVFEETFIPYLGSAFEYAAVDTNVELYVGLTYTSKIADRLEKSSISKDLRQKAELLKNAINTNLWWDEKEAFYPLDVRTNKHIDCLMASTFYPLRMKIATDEKKEKLLALLTNDEHFNWNTIPLTSVSKKDPLFQTTIGVYQGNRSWSGNVWTLINEMVIKGLLDKDENELAVELALKTVYSFNNNFPEFINPFDGSGHGVLKYAWSASQYLKIIIEFIFGITVNADKKEVYIKPNIPVSFKNEQLSIKNVMIFDGIYLDVLIENGKISYNITDDSITVEA